MPVQPRDEIPESDPLAVSVSTLPASLGQKTKAASLPVVLASDQDALALAAGEAHIGSVTADTELPAAALLADNAALPTTPIVGAVPMLYDGVTLDMARSKGAGYLAATLVRSSDGGELGSSAAVIDSEGEVGPVLYVTARNVLHNGVGYDRQRSNEALTVAASAARTATLTTADQTNYNGRHLKVYLNVSAFTTGGLTPVIQGKDPVSGTYFTLLTGAKIVATGLVVLSITPELAAVPNLVAQAHPDRTWRVVCTPDDATAITYSIGCVTSV